MKRIIESSGTVDAGAIAEFETIYKWHNVFNELDQYTDRDLVVQSQNDNSKADLVFERILGHKTVTQYEEWQETSDCWICGRRHGRGDLDDCR